MQTYEGLEFLKQFRHFWAWFSNTQPLEGGNRRHITLPKNYQEQSISDVNTQNVDSDTQTSHALDSLPFLPIIMVRKGTLPPQMKAKNIKNYIYYWRDPFLTSMIMAGRVVGMRHLLVTLSQWSQLEQIDVMPKKRIENGTNDGWIWSILQKSEF